MTNRRIRLAPRTVIALALGLACQDSLAPTAGRLKVPVEPRRTLGPPDQTFTIGHAGNSKVALTTYQYETFVTLEVSDSIEFESKFPVPGASPYYQWPGRKIGATGATDQRISDPGKCALKLFVYGGAGMNVSSFGACGAPQLIDTTKVIGPDTVKRTQVLYENPYDCDPWGAQTCHTYPNASQTVRMRPVPVTIKKLTTNHSKLDTLHLVSTAFKAGFTPDSISVGGNKLPHPFRITLWQWITADSGSTVNPGCSASNLLCNYTPLRSGRMVVKMFVGGWEQSSSASVQCMESIPDFAVNDTTNDWSGRAELLEARRLANVDSADTAGWTPSHPKGWKNENPGVLWQLPNGGGYQFVPFNDPNSTACRSSLPDSVFTPSHAPVTGATPYAGVHVHSTLPLYPMYGCDSALVNGVKVPAAQFPGDTTAQGRPKPAPPAALENQSSAGSDEDWIWVRNHSQFMFILTATGYVFRLEPPPFGQARAPFKTWNATWRLPNRCGWVEKYRQ